MEMANYLSEKKRVDEDYLESAKAKMAILNKYEWNFLLIDNLFL